MFTCPYCRSSNLVTVEEKTFGDLYDMPASGTKTMCLDCKRIISMTDLKSIGGELSNTHDSHDCHIKSDFTEEEMNGIFDLADMPDPSNINAPKEE